MYINIINLDENAKQKAKVTRDAAGLNVILEIQNRHGLAKQIEFSPKGNNVELKVLAGPVCINDGRVGCVYSKDYQTLLKFNKVCHLDLSPDGVYDLIMERDV